MTSAEPRCGLSWLERAALQAGKLLIRLAIIIAIWRFRSAFPVKQSIGWLALRAIGLAATGLGLAVRASLHLSRLWGVFDAEVFGRKAFEPDSFGTEVAAWASSRAVNGGRMVP